MKTSTFPLISSLLTHVRRSMMILLAQGLAILLTCCVLVQCGRARPGKKANGTTAATSPAVPKIRDRPEPGIRITRQSRLSNGIRVATEAFRVDKEEKARVCVTVGVGTRHETEELNGIAHFTEHMLFMGACIDQHRQSFQLLSEDILNGETSTDQTQLNMNCAKAEDVEHAIATLANLTINSYISDVNVDREREVIQDQCRVYDSDASMFIRACAMKLAFHPDSLGLFVQGRLSTNASITASDIRRFYATHYKTNNTIITAVGEVDHDEVVRLAEYHFENYPKGDGVELPPASWNSEFKVCITPSVYIFVGMLLVKGPTRAEFFENGDGFIIELMKYALFSRGEDLVEWRLFVNVVKEFTIVGHDFTSEDGLTEIITRWRYLAYGICELRLSWIKDYFERSIRRRLPLHYFAYNLNMHMFHTGRVVSTNEMLSRVQAITLHQFRAAAKRLFIECDFTLVGYAPPGTYIPTRDAIHFVLNEPLEYLS